MFNLSNQEKITIILLLIVIIIGGGIVLYKNIKSEEKITINRASVISENNPAIQKEVPPLIIHITGAVKNPGVYQLKSTDRVVDAVKIAGGATEEANLDAINLAALLKDGQKIIVPPRIYNENGEEINKNIDNNAGAMYSSSSSGSISGKININTANASMLQSLPGIGPVLSERIIEYRNQNGFFGVIDDIKDVSGIAEKKYEGIRDLICVQ
ncbi:MAG: ComEA family DNA-binding protein [Candidatus Caldatribacteriota bacterium]|nr:ComEA family DNA-binding protein [Candidatus Caldatribacteriota bacterium]